MLVYWSAYLLPALLAVARLRTTRLGWTVLGTLLIVVIGLRYQVGTDWSNYLRSYYEPAGNYTFLEAVAQSDPAFQLLNWIAQHLGAGIWFVNTMVAGLYTAGLIRFVRVTPEPLVAFTAAIPYMTLIVAMNYTRQAAAIGIILWSLVYLYDAKILKYVIGIACAALFHKSAVLMLPLFAFTRERNKIGVFFIAVVSSALGFLLILAEHFEALWQQYVVSDYSDASQGAPLRVAMNALPAAVFLLVRTRLRIDKIPERIWTWISLAAIAAMAAVFSAPTAVDRVALYFSPIQFIVASYLMQLVSSQSKVIARYLIITVYGMVLFVWLNYSANSQNWFPYQFWPFFLA